MQMNDIQLIKSPWADAFAEFGRSVRHRAIIAAPFISAGPLQALSDSFDSDNPPQVSLLTNLASDSLLHGTVNVAAIAGFCRALSDVSVSNLPGLHAKVYVADERLAIITSGNLTHSSLHRNYEYGVCITDASMVREIADDIQEYGSLGFSLSVTELEEIKDIVEPLREKYADVVRPTRNKAYRAYLEEFETMQTALLSLRAKPQESANSIFARTILYILKRGPMPTREMQPLIQSIHPDLCDDSIDRVINGVHFGKRWKHMVRNAQQTLKEQGRIEYRNRQWQLRDTAA